MRDGLKRKFIMIDKLQQKKYLIKESRQRSKRKNEKNEAINSGLQNKEEEKSINQNCSILYDE